MSELGDNLRGIRHSFPAIFWAIVGLYVVVAVLLVAGAVLFTRITNSKASVEQLTKESNERRSATCTTFESQHLEEVTSLQQTYAYLDALPEDELKLTINQFVIKQLPQTERIARSDQDDVGIFVPKFCDEPGVGLPEPDPVPPPRPASLRHLK